MEMLQMSFAATTDGLQNAFFRFMESIIAKVFNKYTLS